MTVIDTLRAGNIGETYNEHKWLVLSHRRLLNVNLFIGLKEVLIRLRVYTLLFIVYLLCAFICILPINVKNTLAAPETLGYMGMPVTDIAISYDMSDAEERVTELIKVLSNDPEIIEWAMYTNELYKIKNSDGQIQGIRTIVGDQTRFHPSYSSGSPPILENEIALTYLLAQDLQKSVGDSLILEIDGEERYMFISGIYQDTSNGGRAIRSCLKQNPSNAFYYEIYLNVNTDSAEKALEYKEKANGASVFTLNELNEKYLGDTVKQIETIGVLLVIIAMIVSTLITALFIKMLTAKETSQIAVMKSLGFSQNHICMQYITRIGLILLTGILAGMLIANIGGEKIMSAVCTTMGAPVMKLIIKPIEVYAVLPIILLFVVYITTIFGCRIIRKITISQINAE